MSSDVIMLMKNHMSSATCACADGWSGMDCSTSAEIMEALQLKNDALISHVRVCAPDLLHVETHSLQHRLWSTPTHPHPYIIPAGAGLVSQHRGSKVHHVEEHVGHRQCDSWRLVLCRPEAGTTV